MIRPLRTGRALIGLTAAALALPLIAACGGGSRSAQREIPAIVPATTPGSRTIPRARGSLIGRGTSRTEEVDEWEPQDSRQRHNGLSAESSE